MSRRAAPAPERRPPEASASLSAAEELLAMAFGAPPPPGSWCLLADFGGFHVVEQPAQWRRERWRLLGPHRINEEPGVEDFLRRGGPIGFYVAPRAQPDFMGTLLPLRLLWGSVKVPLEATRPSEPRPRRDAAAVAAVRRRFAELPLPPGVVLDGGDHLAAVWPLAAPLEDLTRARKVLFVIARALGALPPDNPWLVNREDASDPRGARLLLPGSTPSTTYPPFPTAAEFLSRQPVAVDALERALGGA